MGKHSKLPVQTSYWPNETAFTGPFSLQRRNKVKVPRKQIGSRNSRTLTILILTRIFQKCTFPSITLPCLLNPAASFASKIAVARPSTGSIHTTRGSFDFLSLIITGFFLAVTPLLRSPQDGFIVDKVEDVRFHFYHIRSFLSLTLQQCPLPWSHRYHYLGWG